MILRKDVRKLKAELDKLVEKVSALLIEVNRKASVSVTLKDILADHNKFVNQTNMGKLLARLAHLSLDIRDAAERLEIGAKRMERVIEVANVESQLIDTLVREIGQAIQTARAFGDENTAKILNELWSKIKESVDELKYLVYVVLALHNLEVSHPDLEHFIKYFESYVLEIRRKDPELARKLIKSEKIKRLIRRHRLIDQLTEFYKVIRDESSPAADDKGWNLVRTAYKSPKLLGAEYNQLFRDEETKKFFEDFFKVNKEDKKKLVPAVWEYITKLGSKENVFKVEHEAVDELKHLLAKRMLDLIDKIKDIALKYVKSDKKYIESKQKKFLHMIKSAETKRDRYLGAGLYYIVVADRIMTWMTELSHEEEYHQFDQYYENTLLAMDRLRAEGRLTADQLRVGLDHLMDAAPKLNKTRSKVYKYAKRLAWTLKEAVKNLEKALGLINKEEKDVADIRREVKPIRFEERAARTEEVGGAVRRVA